MIVFVNQIILAYISLQCDLGMCKYNPQTLPRTERGKINYERHECRDYRKKGRTS